MYDIRQGQMRFCYTRHWIEIAHKKMQQRVPILLQVVMDVLDDTLNEVCCFYKRLKCRDILMRNFVCLVSDCL